MKNFFQIFLILFSGFCFGQDNLWYPFFLENSNTMGFKDKNGKVMIEPIYFSSLASKPFKNIYGVTEVLKNDSFSNYYLLKNGKKIGIDSVYYFDTEVAYEREEKIRFRDYKKDKVGFFDKDGKVVIPAVYNEAEDFHNGIAIVSKDGKRWCYDNNSENRKNCEHYGWINTKTIVINVNNQELFEIPNENLTDSVDYNDIYRNFKLNGNVDSDVYTSYKGNDGNVYSFYSLEKDFKKWFETTFLPDFKTNGKILEKYFSDRVELQIKDSSVIINKKDFLKKGIDRKINKLFDDYLKNKYKVDFYDENISDEDRKGISISLLLNSLTEDKNPKSATRLHQERIDFKKIGDSFYITSAP